jgi:hypothetical protein
MNEVQNYCSAFTSENIFYVVQKSHRHLRQIKYPIASAQQEPIDDKVLLALTVGRQATERKGKSEGLLADPPSTHSLAETMPPLIAALPYDQGPHEVKSPTT